MVVFGAPVFHRGNLAFFVAIFSEMIQLFADAVPHLLSIHLSITRESKWRYIMKKINLPDGLQMAVQLAQTVKATASSGKYKSVIKRKFRMGKGAY